MTTNVANLNPKVNDRSSRQHQCVTARGETILFVYPNGHIAPEISPAEDAPMHLAEQSPLEEA